MNRMIDRSACTLMKVLPSFMSATLVAPSFVLNILERTPVFLFLFFCVDLSVSPLLRRLHVSVFDLCQASPGMIYLALVRVPELHAVMYLALFQDGSEESL